MKNMKSQYTFLFEADDTSKASNNSKADSKSKIHNSPKVNNNSKVNNSSKGNNNTKTKHNNSQQIDPEVIKLANITEKVTSNKPGAAKEFSQTMTNDYQIKDKKSFMSKLKSYLIIGGAGTLAVGAVGGIGYLLYKGIAKVATFAWDLASKGGIWGQIALICALALPIIYKILKTIFKKDLSEGSSNTNIIEYKKLELRKVIMESDLMISKMRRIVNSEAFTEEAAEQASNAVVKNSEGICAKIWGWIKKAISAGYRFVKKYPKITCVILIIICFTVACYKNPYEFARIKDWFNNKMSIKQVFEMSARRNEVVDQLKISLKRSPELANTPWIQKLAKTWDINIPDLLKSLKVVLPK